MDNYAKIMGILRDMLQAAEDDLVERKEKRGKIKEKKDAVDADYEYYNESVKDAQKNVTNIKRMIADVLSKTGI